MKLITPLLLGLLIGIAGCASVKHTMTPNAYILDFGSDKIVVQQTVQVSSEELIATHGLGFTWSTNHQDKITISPAIFEFFRYVEDGITEVSFEADGEEIRCTFTQDDSTGNLPVFRVTMKQFQTIANAKKVKMRVVHLGKQTESAFGTEVPESIVNKKFPEFFATIQEVKDGG